MEDRETISINDHIQGCIIEHVSIVKHANGDRSLCISLSGSDSGDFTISLPYYPNEKVAPLV